MMQYAIYIFILISIYAVLALSLDVLVGFLGLVSLAQAAFFGIGAYTTALAMNSHGIGPVVAVALSVLAGIVFSFAVSIPSLRLRGDYFAISAFAFQMLMFSLFNNLVDITGGPEGTSLVGGAKIVGGPNKPSAAFFVVLLALIFVTLTILWRVKLSPYGRLLRAIREDEILAESLGKNTVRLKVSAFALSAAIAAAAGSVYALYIQFIDPTSFGVFESVLILAMVLLWRPATTWGPVLGAAFLVAVPELLRLSNISTAETASAQQILFGLALIVVIYIRGRLIFGTSTNGQT